MRGLIFPILVFLSLPILAFGQSNEYSKGQGYAYFAPTVGITGGPVTLAQVVGAQVGGGGERFFTSNLGAGVDLGYLTPIRSWTRGVGTFSPNFVARFRAKDKNNKMEPFVTGGYTLFFRSGTAGGLNFGGGVNYWLRARVGLRFEIRDIVQTQFETIHTVGFRVGVTFR